MQGERSYLDSFPEAINPNQGSDSNTASMEPSASRDNLLNPVESHLSNYALSSRERNTNVSNPLSVNAWSLGGWYPGESSASANSQNQLFGRELKIDHGWSSSPSTCMVADTSAVDWRYEPPNVPVYENNSSGYGGPYVHRPLDINASSTSNPVNANTSHGYKYLTGESSPTTGKGESPHSYQRGGSETHHFPTEHSGQNGNEFSSSSSPWGSSCKRKNFEGCPRQSSTGGYLSTNPQEEDMGRCVIPAHLNASSSSSSLNARNGVGIGREAPDRFPPTSFAEVRERSQRNFSIEVCSRQQETLPCDLSVPGTRDTTLRSAEHHSRSVVTTELSDLAPTFSGPMPLNHQPNQSHLVQVAGAGRRTIPYSQGEFFGSRGTSSSDPLFFSSQVEAAVRCFPSTTEQSAFGSLAEARNMLLEPPNWSFMPANSSSCRNTPSSSHVDPSSSSRSIPPVWITNQNPATHAQPRFPEQSPWTRFPPIVPAPGGQRGRFSPFSPGPSSSVETVMPSGSRTGVHQNCSHRQSFWRDVSTDDTSGWHALAAGSEGRDRLVAEIRHVLNTMWRAENVGPEDYMMLDPFISGIADVHDRHRDMRLDVDNMSYEDLLALEERIGNVNTGLSEHAVIQLMKQQKYKLATRDSSSHPEPCCVCQEDYIVGDDIGELDCGHEFHTNCIKQWLMLKNLCPICKMTGLLP